VEATRESIHLPTQEERAELAVQGTERAGQQVRQRAVRSEGMAGMGLTEAGAEAELAVVLVLPQVKLMQVGTAAMES
jgi:hypothetical protein